MPEDKKKRRGLKTYLITGFLVFAPFAVTVYVTWWFITTVDEFVNAFLPSTYNLNNFLPVYIPGMGLIVVLFLLTALGFLTANYIGGTLVKLWEKVITQVPMLGTIYSGAKQIFQTFLANDKEPFQKVGLIEHPRPGLHAMVFIAGEADKKINKKFGQPMTNVFLPTAPNPTSGFLIFVPEKEVRVLDITPEQATKMILSAGLVSPSQEEEGEGSQKSLRLSCSSIYYSLLPRKILHCVKRKSLLVFALLCEVLQISVYLFVGLSDILGVVF